MDVFKIILEVLNKNKNRVFLIDSLTEDELTYGEFISISYRVSKVLEELGIKKGDRIAIFMSNGLEFPILYFAAFFSGICVVPISPALNPNEIEFILKTVDPKIFIFNEKGFKHFARLGLKMEVKKGLILYYRDLSIDYRNTINLQAYRDKFLVNFNRLPEIAQDIPYLLSFTSGTTGSPKGVIHSAKNIFSNAIAFNNAAGINQRKKFYHILPMFYMAGFLNMLISPFVAGATVIIGKEFSPQNIVDFWSVPMKYEVDTFWLVPSILSMLLSLDRDKRAKEYCRTKVKDIFVGTAPLSKEDKRRFEDKYCTNVSQSYGLSELLILTVYRKEENEESVGRPIEGVKVRILDKNKNKLGFGIEGEIYVNSDYQMLGYVENGEYKFLRKGWFSTGDLGCIYQDGTIQITGRKKDIIIKGGINISPVAIEKVINKHPEVDSCVAFGVPDRYYGEVIAVALKLKDRCNLDESKNKLVSFCKENLSDIQQPTYFIEVDGYPVTVTGKVQRSLLKNKIIEKLKNEGKIK